MRIIAAFFISPIGYTLVGYSIDSTQYSCLCFIHMHKYYGIHFAANERVRMWTVGEARKKGGGRGEKEKQQKGPRIEIE